MSFDPSHAKADQAALHALSGRLFDEMMGGIDPELTTANIAELGTKYAEETEEDAQARAERYNQAFEAFDAQFQAQQRAWEEQFLTIKRQAVSTTEKKDRETEQTDLAALEKTISAA